MHSRQRARRRQLAAAAVAALLLGAASGQAVSQPESPSSASPSGQSASSQSAGPEAEVARQTALAIAGAASMTGSPANAAQPPATRPGQASVRQMTADQRREFMMLLILHETSRSPIGALH